VKSVQCRPGVFDVRTVNEAKSIILEADHEITTEKRWEKEAPFVVGEIGRLARPTPASVLLDYGCGIGRIAKELIQQFGCTVIGVDISFRMRSLAQTYVLSDNFLVCSPSSFEAMLEHGLRVDHAYAVWVIQHCEDPSADIARLARAVSGDGLLYVANTHRRCAPTDAGWTDDGQDIRPLLADQFDALERTPFPKGVVSDHLRQRAACSLWRRKA
jgi:2-polyprenyl-3-methyl-5-hydroxy-6-metoxy-1,4-benzoquinol methylase